MGEDRGQGAARRLVSLLEAGGRVEAPASGWTPPGPTGPRGVPVRAALAAVAVALAVVAGTLARGVLSPRPSPVTVPSVSLSATASASATGAVTASATPRSLVVVDVVGRVRRPGLVRLAAGARVFDALSAAGGATAGAALQRVNLARVLVDGEQVTIPGPGDPLPVAAGSPGAATGQASAAPVDLNTAGEAELDGLPGVGPVLAGRIVQLRQQHGRFTSVEELGEVTGIGDKLLSRLRALVRV